MDSDKAVNNEVCQFHKFRLIINNLHMDPPIKCHEFSHIYAIRSIISGKWTNMSGCLVAMTTVKIWFNIHSILKMSRFGSCSTTEFIESVIDKYDRNLNELFRGDHEIIYLKTTRLWQINLSRASIWRSFNSTIWTLINQRITPSS